MVSKSYEWAQGPTLEDHTKRKHKVLREYFAQYLAVRCQLPQQERFRLAVVDGFAGGGRYACGSPGSPIIFLEELRRTIDELNTRRAVEGMAPIEIECLLIFNDADPEVIQILQGNCAPILAEIKANQQKLHVEVSFLNDEFESSHAKIKQTIQVGGYRNVLYNLDQCGHSLVARETLLDIMQSSRSAEIFYTFAVEALLAFLNPGLVNTRLQAFGIDATDLQALEEAMSKQNWLGAVERLVFDSFKDCALFVSPFSIHNPSGWRYWLMHFANNYRARQVYNDVLHANSSSQAHYGRSGLYIHLYDPAHESGTLYLFDDDDRTKAKQQLLNDIPKLVIDSGDVMQVGAFYEEVFNMTPAHNDDINAALFESVELDVLTSTGSLRRKSTRIDVGDTIKVKTQRSFFPMFLKPR